jgi:hypothetical protein
MDEGDGAAVDLAEGEGGAGDLGGVEAQAFGDALGEDGLAGAEAAFEGDEGAGGERGGEAAAEGAHRLWTSHQTG